MDRGQKETEAILKQIEKRINQEYKQAIGEIEDQLSDYLRRFEIKDKKWQEWVESGYKTEDQYKKWRMQQMAVGQKWSEQKEQIAYELAYVNETAKNLAKMAAPEIFAENANYSTFKIEKDAKIDTGFTLYSRESVAELIANDPEVLPPVGKKVAKDIAMGKAVKWNKQQLQSVMMQGILQGDSIPKLATRLANTVGDRDRKAAIRNARTMATAAQNAGREQSYKNAQAKGIELEQMWIATLDSRTRHSHRWLDGERKPVGELFSNGCRYPADPEGAPAEIYNCRCTLRAVVKGLERRSGQLRDTSGMDGMTYDEWRDAKATSNPITLPEEKGKAIKQSYINEYRGNHTSPISMNSYGADEAPDGIKTLENKLKASYESNRIRNNLNLTPYEDGLSLTTVDLEKLSAKSADAISGTLSNLLDEYDTSLKHVRLAMDADEETYFKMSGSWAVTYHDYRAGESTIVINENKCGNYDRMVDLLYKAREKKKCIDFRDGTEKEYVATHEFAHSLFNVGEKLPSKNQTWSNEDFTKLKSVRAQVTKLHNEYMAELGDLDAKWKDAELEATRTFDLKKWDEAANLRMEYDKLFLSKYAMKDIDEFMAEAFTASRIGKTQNKYTEAIAKLIKDNYGR